MTPPAIIFPLSESTVVVKILRSFETFTLSSSRFFSARPGSAINENYTATGFSFLIEHKDKGQKLVFDIGLRKDLENFAPKVKEQFAGGNGCINARVEKDIATQLKQGGVDIGSINAVIWSHSHMDHRGDISTFPPSVDLVIGEGTQAYSRPGYPVNPEAPAYESEFEGRNVREIIYDGPIIGGARSYDYFGDGSFYLVNMPGHVPGHIVGLARTTPSSSKDGGASFILMGGDTVHHIGMVRPSPYLPQNVTDISLPSSFPPPLNELASAAPDRPFLEMPSAEDSIHTDPTAATRSRDLLMRFDADPNVWTVISHDTSLEHKLEGVAFEIFPKDANEWRGKGWKQKTFWAFTKRDSTAWQWD